MKTRKYPVLASHIFRLVCMTATLSLLTGCVFNGSLRGGMEADSPVIVKLRLKTQDEVKAEDKKYSSINKDDKFGEEQAFHFIHEESEAGPCNEFDDCSHEKIFFDDPRISDGKDKLSADLFIVEFDDQGRLYHPEQMEHLFEFLKTTMSLKDKCTPSITEPCFDDVSLVVAVHGWRHNASFQDNNLRELRQTLYGALQMEEDCKEDSDPDCAKKPNRHLNPSKRSRKVVGVYVGWRGAVIDETTSIPLLDQIPIPLTDMTLSDATLVLPALTTFWDRKRVAMDVALGSTRELFARLGHLRAYVNAPVEEIERRDEEELALIATLEAGFRDALTSVKGKLGKEKEQALEKEKAIREALTFLFKVRTEAMPFRRGQQWYSQCVQEAKNNNGKCVPMRTLIIGHSFGSLAIYNAISASLIEEVTGGIDRDADAKDRKTAEPSPKPCNKDTNIVTSPHADLIILINPAFEGARFEPLYQASLNRTKTAGYSCRQNPVLAIITGTTDWATRKAFPIGRWFSTRFTSVSPKGRDGESLEDLKQQEHRAERHAVGHIPRYMTHYLDLFPANGSTDAGTTKCLATDWRGISRAYLSPGGLGVGELETAISNIKTKWDELFRKPSKFWPARAFCGQLRLSFAMQETDEEADDPLDNLPDRSDESDPWANQLFSAQPDGPGLNNGLITRNLYNPIWVIRTKDDRIIDGHNGYLNPHMMGFIHQLYRDAVSGTRSSSTAQPDKKADPSAK